MNDYAHILSVKDSESLSAVYSAYLTNSPHKLVPIADLGTARQELT